MHFVSRTDVVSQFLVQKGDNRPKQKQKTIAFGFNNSEQNAASCDFSRNSFVIVGSALFFPPHLLNSIFVVNEFVRLLFESPILIFFFFQHQAIRIAKPDKALAAGNGPPRPDLSAFGPKVLFRMSSAVILVVSSNLS